jgi:hypothetical protein
LVAKWFDERRGIGVDSEVAHRFVEAYRRAWSTWDIEGFLDLFAHDVVYAAHPLEIVVGRESLRTYVRKEEADQGMVRVSMGQPIIGGQSAMVEFWVNALDGSMSVAGCLIFKLDDGTGRCVYFREYWFDLDGTVEPFQGWGE